MPATLANLKQLLGHDGVSDDAAKRKLFSQDVWHVGDLADFIIAPDSAQALADAVKLASSEGISLNPRGGGMSYTKGYTPDRGKTAMIDFTRMNKILEINADDMYVTVQAGVTWKQLYEALSPLGLRTPFWGPLSGISSTIGGGLSQNNAFFGGGKYGPSVNSVTSLTVVTGEGEIIRTGTSGHKNGKPAFREYGPDLTGIFLADAGALAYKAEATLRLIQTPLHFDCASFDFPDAAGVAEAMEKITRTGLACEAFAFDPNLQRVRMQRASLGSDVKTLKNVVTKQGGLLKGIKAGAKLAMAGRGYMDDVQYSLHVSTEGMSAQGVKDECELLRALALDCGGTEIENSIPKIMRANPFGPLNNMLGPRGERWVPIHGIVPLSDGPKCFADMNAMFADCADDIEKHEITTGFLLVNVGVQGYLIEPVFIWPEEIYDLHKLSVEKSHLKKLTAFDPNPDATACVERLRANVLDIFEKYGAAHFQIGRTYSYSENMEAGKAGLLAAIKSHTDPKGLINPGALGLNKVSG